MKGYMFIILNYSIIILNLNRLVYHHTVLPQVIHSHINFAELQLSKYFANDYFENSRFAIRKPIPNETIQRCQSELSTNPEMVANFLKMPIVYTFLYRSIWEKCLKSGHFKKTGISEYIIVMIRYWVCNKVTVNKYKLVFNKYDTKLITGLYHR